MDVAAPVFSAGVVVQSARRSWIGVHVLVVERLEALADVGRVRTSRTYPYGANVPRVRFAPSDRAAVEALLVEVISEGLRCDLFTRLAEKTLAARGRNGIALPRPPELFDLLDRSVDQLGDLIVYPDPPLPDVEREILDNALMRVAPATRIITLGELA